MHRRWYPVWRKIKDSEVWQNPGLLKVWLWCLDHAAYRKTRTRPGRCAVALLAGQFAYGRQEAAVELGMPGSTVRNRMARLEALGMISQTATQYLTVVSITNWADYNDPAVLFAKRPGRTAGDDDLDGAFEGE